MPPSHNFNSVHHDLFEKAGILHRDISIGNLMVDASDPAQGVLIDLDFAARVTEHGDPLDGETFPPAGTLNFRAYDLLTPNKPLKAYYRHDLESFFYTLLWIQLHYVDGKELNHPEANSFEFNFDGAWNVTRSQKVGFLLGGCRPTPYKLPPTSLRDRWLTPMQRLFGEALMMRINASVSHPNEKGALVERDTFDGRITYETFAQILQR
jgi:serine/threonine protein kinase